MAGNDDMIKNIDKLGLIVGSVRVETWEPYDTSFGARWWAIDTRGWRVAFIWTPPREWSQSKVCQCKKVVWTQDAAIGGGPFKTDWDEAGAGVAGYPWEADNPNSTQAAMYDVPNLHGITELFAFRAFTGPFFFWARSYAKCVAGKESGKIYATVLWGFKWEYDDLQGIGPVIK